MFRNILLLGAFFLFATLSQAQPYFSKTIDLEQSSDSGWNIFALEDGLLIYAAAWVNNAYATALLKTNFEGEKQWARIFEGFKAPTYEGIIFGEDGHVFLSLQDTQDDFSKIKLAKLDIEGNWLQDWSFGEEFEGEFPLSLLEFQGRIVLANGIMGNGPNTGWLQFLGEGMQEERSVFFPDDEGYTTVVNKDLIATQDGHLLATTVRGPISRREGVVTKLDSLGQVVWQAYLPETGIHLKEIRAAELLDGNYAVSWYEYYGYSSPLSPYSSKVYKMSPQGDTLWSRDFPTFPPQFKSIHNLNRAANGDIIGMGQGRYDFYPEEIGGVGYFGWVFRMSPEGEVLWDRYIYHERSPLLSGSFYHSTELPNGDLVFVGTYQDTFSNYEPFVNDVNVWLVRVGADGCLIPDCQDMQIVTDTGVVTLTGIEAPPAVEETPFRLFP
ncbi:MAG: hypothetical protein J5I98_08425, partial [Phaeodactylibacter sp.]|nr:hypothetical protein [Phaeodactylibacter sp.]